VDAAMPKRYAAFISHKKSEGAAEGRYLHDQLEIRLGADAFLDSSDLCDLRVLYEEHLDQSEVVIFLCSPSALHSPWVLLELYEAHVRAIPVITIATTQGWSPKAALDQLNKLEETLSHHNPAGLHELKRVLENRAWDQAEAADKRPPGVADSKGKPTLQQQASPRQGLSIAQVRGPWNGNAPSLAQFGRRVASVLRLNELAATVERKRVAARMSSGLLDELSNELSESSAGRVRQPGLLRLSMWESDRQLDSSMYAIIEQMASLTGRAPPVWEEDVSGVPGTSLAERVEGLIGRGRSLSRQPTGSLNGGSPRKGGAKAGAADDRSESCCAAVWRVLHGTNEARYRAFIVCDIDDEVAWAAALALQALLQRRLGGEYIILEDRSIDADDGSATPWTQYRAASVESRSKRAWQLLEDGLSASRSVILLQTRGVLERADSLLQLYEAVRRRTAEGEKLITVNLLGSGYEYDEAKDQLERLVENFERDEVAKERALCVNILHARHRATLVDMQDALAGTVPFMVSVPLDLNAHCRQIESAVGDIVERMGGMELARRRDSDSEGPLALL